MSTIDRHPLKNFLATLRELLDDAAFRAAFASLSAMLLLATVFYSVVEGWHVVDSFYFSVITASTVGFGDFTPQTTFGKLFTVAFVLVSVGLLVLILGRIATRMVERRMALHEREQSTRRRRIRRRVRGAAGVGDPDPS